MNGAPLTLYLLLASVFALLVWGRFRYDVVALSALAAGVLLGVVPATEAFAGFGHPATVIIALVLVVSAALSHSGAVDLVGGLVADGSRGVPAHIGWMAGIGGAISGFVNNVAALALLMPVDLKAAADAKRSPALTLMPLSFATILGGMITMIGTPPNIVIATFREEALGSPYRMFDFAPVGAAVATVGILFVATVGWRLIPAERGRHDARSELRDLVGYVAEVEVAEGSSAIGAPVRELDPAAEAAEVAVLGLIRNGRRLPGAARREAVRPGDLLVVEGGAEAIERFAGETGLVYRPVGRDAAEDPDLAMMELVVPRGARIDGRSATEVRLARRQGVTLLGVSRSGRRLRERVRRLKLQAGDVLLVLGPEDRLEEAASWLGCLPLAGRGLRARRDGRPLLAISIFAGVIVLASLGLVYLPVAMAAAGILYVVLGILPLSRIYDSVEWPVIVLIASLIPLGTALEASGGTAQLAELIVAGTDGLSPVWVLAALMVVTMTLSDVLNNVATAVMTAPIAVDVALRLDVNVDAFLMGVAVASSCAFLTPIGHKNNTIILGPGGYRFGDYWRMGLPLEILVIAVGLPTILLVWPL